MPSSSISTTATTSSTTKYFSSTNDNDSNNSNDDGEDGFVPAIDYDKDPTMIDLKHLENPGDFFLSQVAGSGNSNKDESFDSSPSSTADLASRFQQWAGDYDSQQIQSKIQDWIDESPIFMLTFETCPYCQQVRTVLDAKVGADGYTAVDLDSLGQERYAIRAELFPMIGRTGAPAVWIDGVYVGGATDGGLGGVVTLEKQGKLDGMLEGTQTYNQTTTSSH